MAVGVSPGILPIGPPVNKTAWRDRSDRPVRAVRAACHRAPGNDTTPAGPKLDQMTACRLHLLLALAVAGMIVALEVRGARL